jgi:hypothetical protein
MLLRPNNGGMAEGMACNGVMAWGMAEWSNGRIDGNGRNGGMAEWQIGEWSNGGNGGNEGRNGQMVGMARMMVSIRMNDRIAEWQ